MLQDRYPLAGKLVLAIISVLQTATAFASNATTTFPSQATMAAACTIDSVSTLNFGNAGLLAANVDQTSTIQIQCTDTTPYNIGLDAGTGSGAIVAARKMSAGGNTVNYTLYSDPTHVTVWGNTVSTDTVAAVGNGSAQSFTLYGRVPAQATPASGTYSDTVTLTVTY